MSISDLMVNPDAQKLRSMEQALADLRAKYKWRPSAELARMIEQLDAEIAVRRAS